MAYAFAFALLLIAYLSVVSHCSPLDNPVTWLSTSSMKCPVGEQTRGITVSCTATVEYLNNSYVVPDAMLAVRADTCTHAVPSSCANFPTISESICTETVNTTVCDYTIRLPIPAAANTGGVYTLSLTRLGQTEPNRFPETVITQGLITCGVAGHQLVIAACVALLTVFSTVAL